MSRHLGNRIARFAVVIAALCGCSANCAARRAAPQATSPDHFVLRGGALPGGERVDVEVRGGRIASVGEVAAAVPGATDIDISGLWLAPAAIDSHVHLSYFPVADELAASGVAAAVDLAAPRSALDAPRSALDVPARGLQVVHAGPMLTAVGGYPTRSWGRGGYGLECDEPACAERAVATLARAGARVIKLAAGSRGLSAPAMRAATRAAHQRGMRVVAHALDRDGVSQAARAGVDGLAHTPIEPLTAEQASAWRGKVVISTLAAFGGSDDAIANLRALRRAGAIALYGTDLGNARTPAINPRELALMRAAGMTGDEILDAMTRAPAGFWQLDDLGAIAPGKAASLLVLRADPTRDPQALARPVHVYLAGQRVN